MQQNGFFWLHQQPKFNRGVSAFGAQPPQVAGADSRLWRKIGPAQVETATTTLLPSDNWPFLYLREAHGAGTQHPRHDSGGGAVAGRAVPVRSGATAQNQLAMFFLGAGFMLLETKGWCTWRCCSARRGL
jgi:hypothetical protein